MSFCTKASSGRSLKGGWKRWSAWPANRPLCPASRVGPRSTGTTPLPSTRKMIPMPMGSRCCNLHPEQSLLFPVVDARNEQAVISPPLAVPGCRSDKFPGDRFLYPPEAIHSLSYGLEIDAFNLPADRLFFPYYYGLPGAGCGVVPVL